MLIKYYEVYSRCKDSALSKIKEINSSGFFTYISSSVDNASYDRNSSSNPKTRHLILLTDWVIDVFRDRSVSKFSLCPMPIDHSIATLTTLVTLTDSPSINPQRSYQVGDIDEFGTNLPPEHANSNSSSLETDNSIPVVNSDPQLESAPARSGINPDLAADVTTRDRASGLGELE